MMPDRQWNRVIGVTCAWIVTLEVLLFPIIYDAILDYLGPSTEYYEPTILGADRGPDGKFTAYIGETIFISYIVVRHQINGNCLLNVWRYGEEIGGPRDGTRHLLDYADLQFVGTNELRRPRWPIHGLVVGRDMSGKPLLDSGVDQQEYAFYNVAEYHCNVVDDFMAWLGHGRYLQGGIKPDETERVTAIIRRWR